MPESVGYAHECFAFQPAVAACTERPTSFGFDASRQPSAPPSIFYQAMNVFVGDDPQRSVLVMRMVNAIVFVALLSVALFSRRLAPQWRSPPRLFWFPSAFRPPTRVVGR